MSDSISQEYSDLYKDYYSDKSLSTKRALGASDSVDNIQKRKSGNLGKLLDVGAGNGSVIKEIAQRKLASEIHALEISASGLERITELNLDLVKEIKHFDGYNIPYEDKYFDSAICIHVLEHVEHERLLLKEISRVSREIFVEIPLEGGFRGKINYEFGHINYYNPLSAQALLETSGLEIISSEVTASSLAYEKHLYGPVKGKIRNVARNVMLKGLGNRASDFLFYVYTAHCRPK
jgi:SAM-dependent methyltransferase